LGEVYCMLFGSLWSGICMLIFLDGS